MRKTPIITLFLALLAVAGIAQTETATAPATTQTVVTQQVLVPQQDSERTREELRQLLRRHPPQVGRLLKLDPMLFTNDSWLATYPELSAFVKQHPQIAHNSAYYLEGIYVPSDQPQERSSERIWRDTIEAVMILLTMLTITGVLVWIIRTLIEHRRWSRISRLQAEVHNKLLDRFASNEELLAYIETPGGKRFLESASAPLPLESATRRPSAPVSRILWSVQVGLILLAAGIGLQFVSGSNIHNDVAQPLFAMGVLAISVGVGFVVSAIVSFLISRRLGLWEAPPQPKTAE